MTTGSVLQRGAWYVPVTADRRPERLVLSGAQSSYEVRTRAATMNWCVAADSIVNGLAKKARTINLGNIDMRQLRDQQSRMNKDHWE